MSDTISFAYGAWLASVSPDLGGAMLRLSHGGIDVLRPAPPGAGDPLKTASFVLAPYANRIASARFSFNGEEHVLPRNFGDHSHALHGTAWQSAWQVATHEAGSATLILERTAGDAWPWAYRAEQRLALDDDGLHASLDLINLDSRAMPAGLGFHPYFPRHAATRVQFAAQHIWLTDDGLIPTEPSDPALFGDWRNGAAAQHDRLIDHAFGGWDGAATITDAHSETRITATGARALHFYLPPGADFLCLEPVSHAPNAVNCADMTIDTLAPGETLSLAMRIGHRGNF